MDLRGEGMSKPFLENMSKEERQAFSYLEKMIVQAKVECIQAMPKTQGYDDSKISTSIQSINDRLNTIYETMRSYKNNNDNLVNAHNNLIAETRMLDKYITITEKLFLFIGEIVRDNPQIKTRPDMGKSIVQDLKELTKVADWQNKTYIKYIETGGIPQEEYIKETK